MFKLVRIDDEDHQEIPLSVGKQVIGRGNLLDCDDKRVSRNHAELEIGEDSIIIKSLHINPCFVIKMGEAKIIYQNATEKISLGDKFGLTNNKYFYTFCKDVGEHDICISIDDFQPLKDILNRHKDIGTPYESNEENCQKSENKITNETENKDTEDKASVLPSILTDNLKTQVRNNVSDEEQSNNSKKSEEQSDDCLSQSPGKRLIKQESSSPVDIKKLKTEGTTEDRPQSAGSDASTSGASSNGSSPAKISNRKRERCMYGQKCYRKNAEHKAQFSHPGDADWGSGAQAPCPWGYACARTDPRHWRDHSHPYGMHPPPPPGIKKRRTHIVQRNGKIFYINANAVNFYDDHFEAEDSDGDSVDYDYEFD